MAKIKKKSTRGTKCLPVQIKILKARMSKKEVKKVEKSVLNIENHDSIRLAFKLLPKIGGSHTALSPAQFIIYQQICEVADSDAADRWKMARIADKKAKKEVTL